MRPTTTPRTFLALVLAFCSASSTHAQRVTRADYDRVAAKARTFQGKVRGMRLDPVWIDADTLVYRRRLPNRGWRIVRADAKSGERAEAFDHRKVGLGLGKLLGREQDIDRLDLRPVALDGDEIQAISGNRVFGIDTRTDRVRELDFLDVPALVLSPTRARRSRGSGRDTSIAFANRSKAEVELHWLDHDGNAQAYGTVAPGGTHTQHTFPGHVWRARTKGGKRLGTWSARESFGVAVITDTPAKPDRRRPDRRPVHRVDIVDHNVVLRGRDDRPDRTLTDDGRAEDRYTGRTSSSPDGRYLMVVQEEPAQRRTVHVVNSVPDGGFQPELISYGYLKPGDRIARPRPRLFDTRSGKRVEVSDDLFPNPWSISRFSWSKDGTRFRFLYNERGHRILRLVEIDAKTGSARALIEEAPTTFVDYSQKTWLHTTDDGDTLLWASERSGWNHLYRVDAATGNAAPITSGEWVVRRVVDVDESARTIRFEAMGVYSDQDPYHVHVGRVGFDGSGLTWLTRGDGTHRIEFSPDASYYVDTWSRVDHPPVHELRRTSNGELVCELEHADWSELLAAGWRPTQRFIAKGRDGTTDIWGILHLPTDFDPTKRYPVVEKIYAGPHGHHVPKSFFTWSDAKALAEFGFVVVQIDGMGTNWRSKVFHDVCWKNLGDAGFPDRIAWLRAAAAERPWLDLDRVGIYGGSAGGQNAMRAMLAHGDFYDAAVADCGCHDNRMDKIWWNEAWMGWPIGPHYDEQSNITQAHRLQGQLLLIVGEVDRNVDPASTMKVVDALIRADKMFELLVMPGRGHGAAESAYGRTRRAEFFVRHLHEVAPNAK